MLQNTSLVDLVEDGRQKSNEFIADVFIRCRYVQVAARTIREVLNLSKPWDSSKNRGDISLSRANHRWSNRQWLLARPPMFLSRIRMLIGLVLRFV